MRTTLSGLLLSGLLMGPGLAQEVPDSAVTSPLLLVSDFSQPVFDWQRDHCSRWHIPDTPARAWRTDEGAVALIAGTEQNRVMRGPDLHRLRPDCPIVLRGPENSDPAARADRWWIASVYPAGAGRIEALVHAEFHGHAHPGQCDLTEYLPCWRNALLQAVSTDGGQSFSVDTETPVAALPYPYDPAQQNRTGYFSPSNMLEIDGHLYVFVHAAGYRAQAYGVCLLRRPVGGSASDWRAWDGADFTIAFVDPYAAPVTQPERHVCAPLDGVRGNLTSVVARDGAFLAVSPMGYPGPDGKRVDGFWLLSSDNLIDWSTPQLLMEVPLLWRRDCSAKYTHAYPAFLDPDSATANFQTVDDRFWLTYVRMRLDTQCRASPRRDLMRRDVTVID